MDGMTPLRRWMYVVGAIYLLMGTRLLPWINGAMIESGLGDVAAPGIDLQAGSSFFYFAIDWMGVLGLDLLVLGVALLYAARSDPDRHRILVHVVIWQEAIRGVLADVWVISRPYTAAGFYLGFIVLHLVIIGTGVAALRKPQPAEVAI